MRNSSLMVMALLFALAAMLPQSITAQQEESTAQSPEDNQSSEDKENRGPLPFYFGRLGLSESEKVKLYQIQESYEEQIAKLRKQIEQLEAQRDRSMESLLTPGQKLRLKELREEARLKNEEAEPQETATPEKAVAPN